jgi:hypothetical protein
VRPSHPQPRSRGYPERVRTAALEFRLAETLHGEAGMESEEGTAFSDCYETLAAKK